jgi:hypothetical protein
LKRKLEAEQDEKEAQIVAKKEKLASSATPKVRASALLALRSRSRLVDVQRSGGDAAGSEIVWSLFFGLCNWR